VEGSGLDTLSTGCEFSPAAMSKGEPIRGGSSYTFSARDMPPRVRRKSCQEIFKFVHRRYVVLWDESKRRGWLANGTTALLHLLRACLRSHAETIPKSMFKFEWEAFRDAAHPHRAESALEVLTNEQYRALPVYKQTPGQNDQSDTLLGYQIDILCEMLEKLMDHQDLFVEKYPQNPRHGAFAHLEGWDFNDVAVDASVLSPRIARFDTPGKSWPALVQSIRAVTLFGRDFGDLIIPDSHSYHQRCDWIRPPANQNLLAVLIADLKMMMTNYGGSQSTVPRNLTTCIAWHCSTRIFDSCICADSSSEGHIDRIQVLYSKKSNKTTGLKKQCDLPNGGAVLFHFDGPDVRPQISSGAELSLTSPGPSGIQSSTFAPGSNGVVSSNGAPGFRRASKRPRKDCNVDQQPPQANFACSGSTNPNVKSRPSVPTRHEFYMAIICALTVEASAVAALLDGIWIKEGIIHGQNDKSNAYTTGWMGRHNVVLVQMSGPGKIAGANTVDALLKSFPKVDLALVVGVCGGTPNHPETKEEIRLGDVIIGTEIVQYDLGRQFDNIIVRKNTRLDDLGRPPEMIRAFENKLRGVLTSHDLHKTTEEFLRKLCATTDFQDHSYPGPENDKLYQVEYVHRHRDEQECGTRDCFQRERAGACSTAMEMLCVDLECNPQELVHRKEAKIGQPKIHFGRIGCGDSVMKSAKIRDKTARENGFIAYEMESAGIYEGIPATIVIKSVCDYADSHKNKGWQKHAAATSAACAKAVLGMWEFADTEKYKRRKF
jgi:nucleoside phosphorylase